MDDFLDRYHLPKLNPDQGNDLKSLVTPKEIEADKYLSTKKKKKAKSQMVLVQNSTTPQKELLPILHKLSHKIETEGTLPNSFNEATVILIPKPHKEPQKGKTNRIKLKTLR
jgi:hypothetical protein